MSAPATSALVVARDLERTYAVGGGWWTASDPLRAVGGISFEIMPGRTLAVVGESGCGKSTLARLVTLIEKPTAGTLVLDGVDAIDPPPGESKKLRRSVQLVFQNPHGSLNPRRKIGTILEEPLAINTDLAKPERSRQALAMMAKVGLAPEHYGRYPHMFSGGQRQRVAIARALMLSPKLVVADEPVSALDVSVQAQVLNLLLELQSSLRLTFVFVAHDLSVVRHISDRVAVMYVGQLVELAPTAAVFARPRHPYTAALMRAVPIPDPRLSGTDMILRGEVPSPAAPPAGCYFHPRCQFAEDRCRREAPALRELVPGHFARCHFAEQLTLDAADTLAAM
jgi:dipeptide transport system ATP-binding protein